MTFTFILSFSAQGAEKERANCAFIPLLTSPVNDDVRKETQPEREEEVEE